MRTKFELTTDLTVNNLKNVVASPKAMRESLEHPFFDGEKLVATNGHILIRYPLNVFWIEGDVKSVSIPLKCFDIKTLDVISGKGKRENEGYIYEIDTDLKKVFISFKGNVFFTAEIPVYTPPNYKGIIPTDKNALDYIGVNLDIISDLNNAFPSCVKSLVKLEFTRLNGAIKFYSHIKDCGEIDGLIMPIDLTPNR